MTGYIGRFAPSPTGLLHAGSLVAALASWMDARAHNGRWLVRIEDVDTPRCPSHFGERILQQLAAFSLLADERPVWQSQRSTHYAHALARLQEQGLVYPCRCSRQRIQMHWHNAGRVLERHAELPYPGTCRTSTDEQAPCSWRLNLTLIINRLPDTVHPADGASFFIAPDKCTLHWTDRRLGPQVQDVDFEVGDFVLRRADGCWTYQLAVVVDDADQGISHVVRGADLADNTPRQILLQTALGLPTPHYLHTPLVLAADGEKLSKQTGANALDTDNPSSIKAALDAAARALGLPSMDPTATVSDGLAHWVNQWRDLVTSWKPVSP